MWEIYDYIDERGDNDIAGWTREELQKPQRKKLNSKLNMLAESGGDLPPGLLIKSEVEYIYKLRVQGNPKLRPLLCKSLFKVKDAVSGEEKDEEAFTILIGAKEVSWGFEPKDAEAEASIRRNIILNDPKRRCKHERIT